MQNLASFLASLVALANADPTILLLNDTTARAQSVALDEEAMPTYAVPASYATPARKNKTIITIFAGISYSGEMPIGAITTKTIELALDRLNSMPGFLENYELAVELFDDKCIDYVSIHEMFSRLRGMNPGINRLPIFLSLACESVGIRTMSEAGRYFNHLVLTYLIISPELYYQRNRFAHFYALSQRFEAGHLALVKFMSQMGWRRLAIVSESFGLYDMLQNLLLPRLDRNNITVIHLSKSSHVAVYDDEMIPVFEELLHVDARIILVDADRASGKTCWMHRYGFYGPKYVIMFWYWADNFPSGFVPPEQEGWCTIDMINEVLSSSIFFGDSALVDVHGPDHTDITGITAALWEDEISRKVIAPQNSPFWGYWRLSNYDLTVFAGLLLNKTEEILQTRNKTLLDYVSISENSLDSGAELIDILQERIYDIKMTGMKGIYDFDKVSASNTNGSIPITMSRFEISENSGGSLTLIAPVIFASFETAGQGKMKIISERLKWSTEDGLAPLDGKRFIRVIDAILTVEFYSIYSSIAVAFFILSLFLSLVVFHAMKTNELPWFITKVFGVQLKNRLNKSAKNLDSLDATLLIGNVLLSAAIFFLPLRVDEVSVLKSCQGFTFLLVYGLSLSLTAFGLKLEQHFKTKQLLLISKCAILCQIITTVLASIFVAQAIEIFEKELSPYTSDGTTFFKPVRNDCRIVDARNSLGIMAAMLVIKGILVIRRSLVSYKMLSRKIFANREAKLLPMIFYCLLMLAGAFGLFAVMIEDHVFLIIATYVLIFICCSILLFLIKFGSHHVGPQSSIGITDLRSRKSLTRPAAFSLQISSALASH